MFHSVLHLGKSMHNLTHIVMIFSTQVLMGSVLPAAMGQAPDRQAAIFAGIPQSVPCTMVNKGCEQWIILNLI